MSTAWIPLNEQMPAERVPVLVYYADGDASGQAVCHWDGRLWRLDSSRARFLIYRGVTHWRPLPDPPETSCASCGATPTPGEPSIWLRAGSGGACIRCGNPLCAFCLPVQPPGLGTASARCRGCDSDAQRAVEELERHYAAFAPDAHLEMEYEDHNSCGVEF